MTLNQSIYRGGQIWRAWSLRKEAIQTAKFSYFEQEQKLVTNILQLAVSLYTAEKIMNVLEESKEIQKQFLEIVKKRSLRGATKDFEVSQAEGDYYSYESKISQQKSIIQQAKLQLATLLNLSHEDMALDLLPPQKKRL